MSSELIENKKSDNVHLRLQCFFRRHLCVDNVLRGTTTPPEIFENLFIAHCKNDLEERRLSANAFLSEQCVADMVAELGITLVNAVCVNYILVDT